DVVGGAAGGGGVPPPPVPPPGVPDPPGSTENVTCLRTLAASTPLTMTVSVSGPVGVNDAGTEQDNRALVAGLGFLRTSAITRHVIGPSLTFSCLGFVTRHDFFSVTVTVTGAAAAATTEPAAAGDVAAPAAGTAPTTSDAAV